MSVLKSNFEMLLQYALSIDELENDDFAKNFMGDLYDGANTNIGDLLKLRGWYRKIKSNHELSLGDNEAIKNLLYAMQYDVAMDIYALKENGIYNCIKSLVENINEFRDILENEKISDKDFTLGENGVVLGWYSTMKEFVNFAMAGFINKKIMITEAMDILLTFNDLINKIDIFKNYSVGNILSSLGLSFDYSCGLNCENFDRLERFYNFMASVSSIDNESIRNNIYSFPGSKNIEQIKNIANEIASALESSQANMLKYKSLVDLDESDWFDNCADNIQKIHERNELAILHASDLLHWLSYKFVRDQLCDFGLENLIFNIEKSNISIENAFQAYNSILYDMLAKEVYKYYPEIKEFIIIDLEAQRQLFIKCDIKLKGLQQKFIAASAARVEVPEGNGRRTEYLTNLALIRREYSKKRRHISIRQLIERAHEAILALKPCFMMGPLAVAQYLTPGLIEFDIIVIDEASQIKPEDAIGVIARGKQVVIIGDPKQLPPTNFFDTVIDDSDDNNGESNLIDSQSILDAAWPALTRRCLKWHYRSKHQSLIEFSNYKFYESRLSIFPSPYAISDEYGIKRIYINNAIYDNNCNYEEANYVANAVREHLVNCPDESLGVVAMNIHQADLIYKLLEKLCKSDQKLRHIYESSNNAREPLFIKNLENVQGDERDVIYISLTYGRSKNSDKVLNYFGPLTGDAGWRRLNVLFTRSKKRMHIFTSMRPEDIRTTETSSKGINALKDFLVYAETGILDKPKKTDKGPDSDFEIAVATELNKAGYDIDFQVGVAGFFIDVAVKHPSRPGIYIMGIECDGATYHSLQSIRDRDRLRQEILESKGWNIRRIWSTDWFKDHKTIINSIVQDLRRLH